MLRSPERPVAYLDIDDTIVCWPPYRTREWWAEHKNGEAPVLGEELLNWFFDHFDVRWLTCWCANGRLDPDHDYRKLQGVYSDPLIARMLAAENPQRWRHLKHEALDSTRDWVWLEDGLSDEDIACLASRGDLDRYYYTNSSFNPNALFQTHRLVAARYGFTPVPRPELSVPIY